MSQERCGPWTGTAGEALVQNRRVKFDGTNVVYADIEEDHGRAFESVFASGDKIAVRGPEFDGTELMVASGAITAGVNVYPDTDGKITATVQGTRIGVALEAATADLDEIEIKRVPNDANNFETSGLQALTGATMAVTEAMTKNGKVSTSHSGAATVTLPAGKEGMRVTITKIDANAAAHTIDPDGAELIQGASTFTAMDAQFDSVTLEWMGGTIGWNIVGKHIA